MLVQALSVCGCRTKQHFTMGYYTQGVTELNMQSSQKRNFQHHSLANKNFSPNMTKL